MMLALPERKWFGRFLMLMAILISTATIYGRYHYAADGLAGLAISLSAFAITVQLRRGASEPVSVSSKVRSMP